MRLKPDARCPCGSGQLAARCCLPYLRRKAWPPTAEALMRSRYTAFVLSDFAWLRDSHHPSTRATFDEADTRQWNAGNHWISLTILETQGGGPTDDVGHVRFEAITRRDGREHMRTEHSRFERLDGRWFYVDESSDGSPSSSAVSSP